jgi:hypothetical protein
MTRPDKIGGAHSTTATILVWNELHWRYDEIVDCVRGEDARARYLALHAPPMVYVRAVRYGLEPAIYPPGMPAYGRQVDPAAEMEEAA